MPELPEVETVCRGLAKALTGSRIVLADAHRADLRAPIPSQLKQELEGHRLTRIKRRAKYILIELDSGVTLLFHLGMSGRIVLSRTPGPLKKHDHISLSFDNGIHLRFNDPRRFGLCALTATNEIEKHKLLRGLGTEPLSDAFTPRHLFALLKGRKAAIKTALLDQRLIAGIGNIYACEALFLAGISPKRRAGSCTRDETARLTAAIRKVLNAAIRAGGSSLRDYVQADGSSGMFQTQFAVYGREGQPCPGCTCSKTSGIRRTTQGGRSTFYCPQRQK